MSFCEGRGANTMLRIYVQPGASKNEITGFFGEPPRLKVKIKASPQDGEANLEVIAFFARTLGVSKSKIQFIRGETSRNKDLVLELTVEEVRLKLGL